MNIICMSMYVIYKRKYNLFCIFVENSKMIKPMKYNDNEIINNKIWDWFVAVRAKNITLRKAMQRWKVIYRKINGVTMQ